MTAKPTANDVLDATMSDHVWRAEPLTLDTTDGIRRTLIAQGNAIQALADYIDGKIPEGVPVPVAQNGPERRASK